MITWSKYFDRIYVVSSTNPNDRQQISDEVGRVGMNSSGILQFRFISNSKLNEYAFSGAIPRNIDFVNEKHMSSLKSVLGLYRVFHECIGLKLKRVLVVENACRFVRDINEIQLMLDHLPSDWDFIQFDRSSPSGYVSDLLEDGEFYQGRYIGGFSSSVCNAYSLSAAYIGSMILDREFYLPGMLFANNINEPRIHVLRRYIAAKNIIEHGEQTR